MSHVFADQAAWGMGHEDGSGWPDVMSAGISFREKCHILTPFLSHKCANTPPPALLNPVPNERVSGSEKAQPALCPSPDSHSVPMTFAVNAFLFAGPFSELRSRVHLPPPLPEWRVYWLVGWLLTPSMTSISPALGQLGPVLHLELIRTRDELLMII